MSELSTEEAWRRAVLSGLKGAPFEKLVATSAEAIPIEPLYLPKHAVGLTPRGEPGAAFTWGWRPLGWHWPRWSFLRARAVVRPALGTA